MKRKITNIIKIMSLPLFCLFSSCSNNQKLTIHYEVTLNSLSESTISSIIKKNQSTLFTVNPEYDCTLLFLLAISRSGRHNDEEALVEHFEDKEIKKLIKSYEYQYFSLTKDSIIWLTYIEIDCKKDDPVFINVRGKRYSGGNNDSDCDTYSCTFTTDEREHSTIKSLINSAWPIV